MARAMWQTRIFWGGLNYRWKKVKWWKKKMRCRCRLRLWERRQEDQWGVETTSSWRPAESCTTGLPREHQQEMVDNRMVIWRIRGACQAPTESTEEVQGWHHDSVNNTENRCYGGDRNWLTAISQTLSPNVFSLCHTEVDTLQRVFLCVVVVICIMNTSTRLLLKFWAMDVVMTQQEGAA